MIPASGFVEGLRQGAVRVLACPDCGARQILDPFVCGYCGGAALNWTVVPGEGYVRAVTEVHRAPSAEFRALVPYTLVLVDLDGGGCLMGHGSAGVAIGARVLATTFHDAGLPLIRFLPAGAVG